MKIKITKFENYVTGPLYAHYNDSASDVYATCDCTVPAHGIYKMPLGFGVDLPDGYDLIMHCKSGLSCKGIFVSNSPVDAGYKPDKTKPIGERGEIHAILINISDTPYEFKRGEKIASMRLSPVIYAEFVDDLGTERCGLGFGSTGK